MQKIKATLRIPTKHQYAYIEVQVEGTPQEIAEAYIRISETYWAVQDKSDKEPKKPPF